MNNAELIMGLRWCADESICCDDFSGEKCPYFDEKKDSCSVDEILHDAADALEADERLLDQNTERCEALRKQLRESHEGYEKHINELTTKCNQLQAAVDNYEKRIAELESQMPKEGEWIKEPMTFEKFYNAPYVSANCSICGTRSRERGNYCPNCGAKMRGEHDADN